MGKLSKALIIYSKYEADLYLIIFQACELVKDVLDKDRRQRDELLDLYREAQQYIAQQPQQQRYQHCKT